MVCGACLLIFLMILGNAALTGVVVMLTKDLHPNSGQLTDRCHRLLVLSAASPCHLRISRCSFRI